MKKKYLLSIAVKTRNGYKAIKTCQFVFDFKKDAKVAGQEICKKYKAATYAVGTID